MISGINAEGQREILGMRMGDSESEAFWRETFNWLKKRELKDVPLAVSDDNSGLVQATRCCLHGQCRVHMLGQQQ